MNFGSRPCAPRYFDDTASSCEPAWLPRAPKSPPGDPPVRELAPVSAPESLAITDSIGPPGANCTTKNDTSMIPKTVGIMSRRRRMI